MKNPNSILNPNIFVPILFYTGIIGGLGYAAVDAVVGDSPIPKDKEVIENELETGLSNFMEPLSESQRYAEQYIEKAERAGAIVINMGGSGLRGLRYSSDYIAIKTDDCMKDSPYETDRETLIPENGFLIGTRYNTEAVTGRASTDLVEESRVLKVIPSGSELPLLEFTFDGTRMQPYSQETFYILEDYGCDTNFLKAQQD